ATTTATTTAATAPAATPHAGYSFTVGAPPLTESLYAYSLKQTVAWTSAGDQLTYTSTLIWKFTLMVAEATPERAVLDATILRVLATHDGPGSHRQVDSGAIDGQDGSDDPLLGHLLALNGAVLSVVVAPSTGVVSEVRGGDAIIAKINKRAPALTPGDTPPLEAAARAAFSSEALTRIWNQLLLLPSTAPTRVPLGPPLNGEVERTWQANSAYTLRLPAGTDHLNATLVGDPTPVSAVLSDLTGSGSTSITTKGMPGAGKGELAFSLAFQALTQPVVQKHTLTWELTPLTPRR
ncbi:MAG TPA: hypothetical protein VHX44_14500, partial [Planctomycetota bacterium]|nr:hypothetical protein [Planctomycetota bacterium]